MPTLAAAVIVVAFLATPGTAGAQGRGVGGGKGRQPATAPVARSSGQTSIAPLALQPSSSFPQFGTWLDDASTAAPGAGFAVIGATYWRGSNAEQVDAPIIGVTYGITRRAQLSATVPFYRLSYEGFSGSGLDNVYISGKFAIVSPEATAGGFGVAVGTVAEILSAGFAEGSRAHWAVPLSLELRAHPVRLYGSTGYFSRGAFFAAGAVEWTSPAGTSLTASFAHSATVDAVTGSTTVVPAATLRDVSVFISHPVSSSASVYVGGGRTFSRTEVDGASSVAGGLSFRFAGA